MQVQFVSLPPGSPLRGLPYAACASCGVNAPGLKRSQQAHVNIARKVPAVHKNESAASNAPLHHACQPYQQLSSLTDTRLACLSGCGAAPTSGHLATPCIHAILQDAGRTNLYGKRDANPNTRAKRIYSSPCAFTQHLPAADASTLRQARILHLGSEPGPPQEWLSLLAFKLNIDTG